MSRTRQGEHISGDIEDTALDAAIDISDGDVPPTPVLFSRQEIGDDASTPSIETRRGRDSKCGPRVSDGHRLLPTHHLAWQHNISNRSIDRTGKSEPNSVRKHCPNSRNKMEPSKRGLSTLCRRVSHKQIVRLLQFDDQGRCSRATPNEMLPTYPTFS